MNRLKSNYLHNPFKLVGIYLVYSRKQFIGIYLFFHNKVQLLLFIH